MAWVLVLEGTGTLSRDAGLGDPGNGPGISDPERGGPAHMPLTITW